MYSIRNGEIIYNTHPDYKINKLSVMIEMDDNLKTASIMKHGDIKDVEEYMYLFSAAIGSSDVVHLVDLEKVFEEKEEQIMALDYMMNHTLSSLTYDFVKSLYFDNDNLELIKQKILGVMIF